MLSTLFSIRTGVIFMKKKYTAVTLFEVLLVLFLSSVVSVGAFKYFQKKKQYDVAETLANRMYFFSQAVRAFTLDNQVALDEGAFHCPAMPAGSTCSMQPVSPPTNPITAKYVFTGVTWLSKPVSGKAYVDEDFTFDDLSPLVLQREQVLGQPLTGDAAVQASVQSDDIIIDYGVLYDVEDMEKTVITATAATKATHWYDADLGPSAFDYVGGMDDAGNPMPIQATLHTPFKSNMYLRQDGTNAMQGDVSFASNGTQPMPIQFNNDAGGVIENVLSIVFRTQGTISNIDQIYFGDVNTARPFSGIYPLALVGADELEALGLRPERNFCGLAEVKKNSTPAYCRLKISDTGYYKLERNSAECHVQCFLYAPR